MMELDRIMRGAKNIAEKAGEFRAEAEARLAQAAQRPASAARALPLADAAFAAAYELENGDMDVLEAMDAGFRAIRGQF